MPEGKYIVFKRNEFYELMGELALPPHYPRPDVVGDQGEAAGTDWDCAPIAQHIEARAEAVSLKDAVVIRRQDVFAPPALDAYANSIRVALSLTAPTDITQRLSETADFFHEQAVLSWDAHRKLPD